MKGNLDMNVTFRQLTVEDLDAIYEIEQASFSSPWTKEAFLHELTENPYATYLGLELDGQLIGYGGFWLIIDEAHITNIAILPDYRGQKLGEALLKKMLDVIMKQGGMRVSLEVRVSNTVAQNLYRKLGFEQSAIRKGYYSDNHEDAIIMWVNLHERTIYSRNRNKL